MDFYDTTFMQVVSDLNCETEETVLSWLVDDFQLTCCHSLQKSANWK